MAPTATADNGHHSASPWSNQTFTHIIDGKSFEQKNANRLEVINPATEE
jgi:hypothetical protein